jgi:DNA-binding MarR family transcriptional regulator
MTETNGSSDRARAALEGIAVGAVAVTTRALATPGAELTFAQWRVVVIVGDDPGGATVTEVAARLGAEISPASRLVSRLARRGFIRAGKDPDDRRVTRVTLTGPGRDLREAVLQRRREMLADVLNTVGPIAPDVEAALDRIAASLRRYT